MMNYYYLVASLPALQLDDPPPFSIDTFRNLCGEHLSSADLKAIDDLIEGRKTESHNEFIKTWRDTETQLRNAIARLRATKTKQDSSPYLKPDTKFDALIEKAAADAFAKGNPLERELSLDKFRWEQLNDLAGLNPFAGKAVLAYMLKLMLAQRWAELNDEQGQKNADDIIDKDPADEDNREQ